MAVPLFGQRKLDAWLAETSEPEEITERVKRWIFDALLNAPLEQDDFPMTFDHEDARATFVPDTDVAVAFAFGETKGPIRMKVVFLYSIESLHDL